MMTSQADSWLRLSSPLSSPSMLEPSPSEPQIDRPKPSPSPSPPWPYEWPQSKLVCFCTDFPSRRGKIYGRCVCQSFSLLDIFEEVDEELAVGASTKSSSALSLHEYHDACPLPYDDLSVSPPNFCALWHENAPSPACA